MTAAPPPISVLRLRLGIILFAMFWLPAYLLAPAIAVAIGDESAVAKITVGVMLVQTAVGLLGLAVAGKQVTPVVKGLPKKQIPKTIWQLFWHGQTDQKGVE